MTDRAPFIRKVAEPEEEGVSHPVVRSGQMGYGDQGVERRFNEEVPEGGYSSDDPRVLQRFFGMTEGDWERVF